MANYEKKRFCPQGHDTQVTGRYDSHCKECVKVYQKIYRKAHPDKIVAISRKYEAKFKERIADSKLRSKYGITLTQKETMFQAQSGKCATCSFVFLSVYSAHVDHCHISKKVRGLLCSDCNLVAGKVKDSPARLRSIADYLEQAA